MNHQPNNRIPAWALRFVSTLSVLLTARRLNHRADPERGDVPGWVLITLMTAGIVVVLMAVAGPTLQRIFLDAMASVTG